MRCLLFGHTFQRMKGAGPYAGQEFLVCTECSKTKPAEPELLDSVAACFASEVDAG